MISSGKVENFENLDMAAGGQTHVEYFPCNDLDEHGGNDFFTHKLSELSMTHQAHLDVHLMRHS